MPRFSVLTSLYCSSPYIEEFYERSLASIKTLGGDYEIVFVDDGSPDNGNEVVQKLIERDSNVRLIELSRNFGHHKAIMIGLEHVCGEYVFTLDSDLEEPPELLEAFYARMQKGDDQGEIDVVYGVMEERKGGLMERVSGALFYRFINMMSDLPIPENALAARLMRLPYVKSLNEFRETQLYLGGVMMLAGYNQVPHPTQKGSKGQTTYTFARKVTLALDALISYTNKPLTFIASFGIFICVVSCLITLYFLTRYFGGGDTVEGWIWVLASVWFLGGLTILSIGMVGFYVGRIFIQVKGRPNAIVKKIHN